MRRLLLIAMLLALAGCGRGDAAKEKKAAAAPPRPRQPTVFPPAPPPADLPPEEAARIFLDWYAPLAVSPAETPAWWLVLQREPSIIAAPLLDALREDSAALARGRPAVTRDFDPFLAAAQPCGHYEPAEALGSGTARLLRIHAVCDSIRSPAPAVVLELMVQDRTWVLFNVHYPQQDGDLLGLLDRRHHPR